MKNLERIFLIVVFFITATSMTFAQTVGVKAGLNLSTVLMKDNTTTYSTDFKMNPGFNVGVLVDFPIGEVFVIEPGLLLSTKGFKEEFKEDIHQIGVIEYKNKTNLYYLDIPVYAKAAFGVGDDVELYGAFGPYLGVGLWGKMKSEVIYNGEKENSDENIKWGNDAENDHFERVDYGLSFGAGVEFYSVFIEATYGLGLANISPYTEDGFKTNNRVLGISAGYRFGGK
jgi:hypothetical protein